MQNLYSLPRNLRVHNKSPLLLLKKPLCTGNLRAKYPLNSLMWVTNTHHIHPHLLVLLSSSTNLQISDTIDGNENMNHQEDTLKYNFFVYLPFFFFFFFLIGIHFMQGWTTTSRHGVKRKRNTKRFKQTWNLFRKNLQLKGVC